jgi:hypothetical protein
MKRPELRKNDFRIFYLRSVVKFPVLAGWVRMLTKKDRCEGKIMICHFALGLPT